MYLRYQQSASLKKKIGCHIFERLLSSLQQNNWLFAASWEFVFSNGFRNISKTRERKIILRSLNGALSNDIPHATGTKLYLPKFIKKYFVYRLWGLAKLIMMPCFKLMPLSLPEKLVSDRRKNRQTSDPIKVPSSSSLNRTMFSKLPLSLSLILPEISMFSSPATL